MSLTSEDWFFAGITGDLSTGGIFVSTYAARAVGTQVDVDLVLPDGQGDSRRLQARGTVQWVRSTGSDGGDPGIGIAFEGLSAEDRECIESFFAQRPPLYYDV